MRRWLSLTLILAFMVALLPTSSLAASSDQKLCAQYGACWYDANSACLASGPAGSGPLMGPFFPKVSDTADLVTRIQAYLNTTQPDSPFVQNTQQLVTLGQKYNVNPAFMIGDAQDETSLGTAGYGRSQNNPYDIRGDGPGGFAAYPTFAAGIEAYYQQISSGSYLGAPTNMTTILQIEEKATPFGDGANNPVAKTALIQGTMTKILGGIATDASSTAIAPVSSCGAITTSAGALGWDLSGPHAMVNYDQGDPRWANDPYGAGKDSIGSSGCGPTSMAMVAATLTGNTSITPLTIANQYGAQYHTDGTSWAVWPVFASDYGLTYTNLGTNLTAAANIIRQGGLVIIAVNQGYFTNDSHLMVIRAVTADGTGFYLADPNGDGLHHDSETRAFTADFLAGQGNMIGLFGFTKPGSTTTAGTTTQ